ncbi:MAG: efflux RND transporter permease subunit [Holophagales bacterium]|nr:efflux RND transporter permease subunit [Holophagales bacterium]
MLKRILERPVSITIATLALVVLGLISLWRVPVSLLPTLERPRLGITFVAPELGREELLLGWVQPAERRLRSAPGVVEITSLVDDGEGHVLLETEWQTDVGRLRLDVDRRLSETLASSEGSGLQELRVEVVAGDPRPVLEVAVLGGDSAHSRTTLAEKILVPELGRIPGAGRIELVGTSHRRPIVKPRIADLGAAGLTVADLFQRLEPLGMGRPLGRVGTGGTVRPLVLTDRIADLDQLRRLPVGPAGGLPLEAVAEVSLGEVPAGGAFRSDGQPGTLIEVYRAPGANAVLLAREGRQRIRELAGRAHPLRLHLLADGSREVVAALSGLGQAAAIGLLLGTFVLWLFLGSWRPTLALAVVVPVSIVAAITAFFVFDVALDVVSLAGLALAAGMLVDNSIVVLESIAAARERREEDPVLGGTRQIAGALVASLLTTAAVFLPLMYLRGLARAFFGVQAFAIVVTLVLSLAFSLSLTPILARRLAATAGGGRSPGRAFYLRWLDRALHRPAPLLFSTVLFLGLSASVVVHLPRQILPAGVSQQLGIEVSLPRALALPEAERRLLALEGRIRERLDAEATAVVYRGDGSLSPAHSRPRAMVYAWLRGSERMKPAILEARRELARFPGLEGHAHAVESAVTHLVDRIAAGFPLELAALTPARLERLVERVSADLGRGGVAVSRMDHRGRAERPGSASEITGAARPAAGDRPLWSLRWDAVRLAGLGLDREALELQIRRALGGYASGRARILDADTEVWIPRAEGNPEEILLRAADPDGGTRLIPLTALATLEPNVVPPPAERRGGRPAARLLAHGPGARVEPMLHGLGLGPDETVRPAGAVRELRRSFSQLALVIAVGLLLVYLTVAALYESLILPAIVIVTVPTAAAGAFWALGATGQGLDVMALLGVVLLAGIVVNNAIVLIHRAEQLRRAGAGVRQAIRSAAAERYRPILMTTGTTFLGMLPLALAGGEGLELRRALATAVSGGLVTSWAATLLIVPILYSAMVGSGRARGVGR